MQLVLVLAVAVHVLSSVFWAGSTFVLARNVGAGAGKLFRPQMGAATVTVLAGVYLWSQLHTGGFGRNEQILALGAVSAIVAAGVQGALVGRALRKGADEAATAPAHRISAGLLALALVCMTTARHLA
ncbi:MAG: hypothetical protein JF588_22760 [Caulobacterales bacterium]|nr:hypothetical protein [Caulobacterales bacterium]